MLLLPLFFGLIEAKLVWKGEAEIFAERVKQIQSRYQ